MNMRSVITVRAQGGVDETANMGSRYYQAVRQYRVRLLEGTGIEPLFPIWTTAEEMPRPGSLDAGSRSRGGVDLPGPQAVGQEIRGSAMR